MPILIASRQGRITGPETLDQSFTTAGDAGLFSYTSPFNEACGTFTAGATGSLTKVTLKLAKQGSPPSDASIVIQNTTSGEPNGTDISSIEAVTAASLSGTLTEVDITFSTPAEVTNGTKYAIVMYSVGANSSSNYYQYEKYDSGGYAGGSRGYSGDDGATWTMDAPDIWFKTYVQSTI